MKLLNFVILIPVVPSSIIYDIIIFVIFFRINGFWNG